MASEHDVLTYCERAGRNRASGGRGPLIGVNADSAEIVTETRLHEGASGWV